MKAKIRVLTPVHIGSGQSISPTGYFVDKTAGNFNFLKMDSLFQDPGFQPYQAKFLNEARFSRYIGDIVTNHQLLKKHVLYAIPASPQARQTNPTEVKEFTKSAGRPFIPGSSLKGAIISALLFHALKELYKDPREKTQIESYLTTRDKKKVLNKKYSYLLDKAYNFLSEKRKVENNYPSYDSSTLNYPSPQGRFTNLLDVSDSSYLEPQSSLKIEYSQVSGGRRGGIPILYETLKINIEAEVDIVSKISGLDERKILEICHNFYEKVSAKDTASLSSTLSSYPYLLRIGQGSSAFSTSFLILAEELQLRGYWVKPPKTRKLIIDGSIQSSFGYIQLTI